MLVLGMCKLEKGNSHTYVVFAHWRNRIHELLLVQIQIAIVVFERMLMEAGSSLRGCL